MLGDFEAITVKLVAVEGAIDDWALYVAPGDWEAQKAKEQGSKLTEDAARAIARALAARGLFKKEWDALTYRD
jgi:hypothetical protein